MKVEVHDCRRDDAVQAVAAAYEIESSTRTLLEGKII